MAREPFAIRLTHAGTPKPTTLPLVTLTQRHDMALVEPPVVMRNVNNRGTGAAMVTPGHEPTRTFTASVGQAVVIPVAGNTYETTPGNRAKRADDAPMATVHGTLDRGLVVPPMGNVDARPAGTAPAPTQTTTTRASLVDPGSSR